MSASASTIDETLKESVLTHPFGDLKDPNYIKSTNHYFTGLNLVNLSTYATNDDKIFAFDSIANVEVEKNLKVWSVLKRTNSKGVVPEVISNQVRLGALNSIFGYLSGKTDKHATVVASSDALNYFKTDLKKNQAEFNLNLQVSALDYFQDSLVSNYATALTFANDLNLAVFTPLFPAEAQHLSVLTSVFSQTQKTSALNLYDGLSYLKQSVKFDKVLDLETNLDLHNKLTAASDKWSELSYVERPTAALKSLNEIVGTKYAPFEYHGSANATKVFVIYGSVESELFINQIQSRYAGESVGVVAIRVPLPFNVKEFVSALPQTIEQLVIIGQALTENSSSVLKAQIQAAVFLNGLAGKVKVEEFVYLPNFVWSGAAVQQIVNQFVDVATTFVEEAASGRAENFIFWSLDNSDLVDLSSRVAHTLSLESSVKFQTKFDHFKSGGVYQAQISGAKTVGSVDAAELVYVDDVSLLTEFNVVKTVKKGGIVLLRHGELPREKVSEFLGENLPKSFLKKIAANENKLIVVDLANIPEIAEIKGFQKLITVLTAFWRSSFPELNVNDLVRKILVSLGSAIELLPAVLTTIIQEKLTPVAFKEIAVDAKWLEAEAEPTEHSLPTFPLEHSFRPASVREDSSEFETISSNSKVELLKRLTFQGSFVSKSTLRPDLAMKNFVVKVKENRRVTPDDYSRNIFHIEFDIKGTGLKYDIGEALGVHARNNDAEVAQFIDFYGLDANKIVEVPNKDDNALIELRTVYQTFVENLDLLGKPGKSFYEALAPYATEAKEEEKLKFLASADGAAELKSYQEDEFFSYSDILRLFPSAHPPLAELVKIIPTLKRREYSISSSQKLHPDEVHLLIVVVDWVDKRQRQRFGQCSKYLSDLAIGSELVVSVKPSVMKLPPLSTQPVIMSGLGTGLAPFKAIIEEKIWQKSQGLEIGEVYLYLGSRHRREEYLYGELWEAYKAQGILTHIGAAFSRDQPQKVYIQDKIRENINELSDLIVNKGGVFYLCGPTWPVPDITAVLEDIVESDAKERGVTVDKARVVEEMKEESRYILEVY